MRCIILNGPPGVGKDTIADYMVKELGFKKMGFKTPLIEIACRLVGMSVDEFMTHYTRELKEKPWERLRMGLKCHSPRSLLIHVSENCLKPVFGQDIISKALVDEVLSSTQDVVFADGGFVDEINTLYQALPGLVVVQLHRPGYDFSNDSRSYVEADPSIGFTPKICKVRIVEDNVPATILNFI